MWTVCLILLTAFGSGLREGMMTVSTNGRSARRGSKRAIVAVAHGLLRVAYVVLQSGEPYTEPTPRPIPDRIRHWKADQLARRLRQLGYEVTMRPKAA